MICLQIVQHSERRSNEVVSDPSHLETSQEQTLAQQPEDLVSLIDSLAGTFGRVLVGLRMSLKRFGHRYFAPGPLSSLSSPHH
jgi:hypothetical protein